MKYTGKMYAGVISVARRKVITEVYSEYYPDVIDMIFAKTYPEKTIILFYPTKLRYEYEKMRRLLVIRAYYWFGLRLMDREDLKYAGRHRWLRR